MGHLSSALVKIGASGGWIANAIHGAGHLQGPQSANGEEMVAAMDAVGVDAAIFVSTFNLY